MRDPSVTSLAFLDPPLRSWDNPRRDPSPRPLLAGSLSEFECERAPIRGGLFSVSSRENREAPFPGWSTFGRRPGLRLQLVTGRACRLSRSHKPHSTMAATRPRGRETVEKGSDQAYLAIGTRMPLEP